MATITLDIHGSTYIAFESKRPKGYRIAYGRTGVNVNENLEVLKAAVIEAGYIIIKETIQGSPWGASAVIYFK